MNFKTIVHCQKWEDAECIYIMESTGSAMVRITKYDGNEAYLLSDLYVNPVLRKYGLGTLMIERAIKECHAHAQLNGIEHCIVEIAVNDHSEKFCADWYQRMGFVLNRREASVSVLEDDGLEWSDIYRLVV